MMPWDEGGPVLMCCGACLGCGRLFWFDPDRVPAVRIDPQTGGLPASPAGQARSVAEPVCPGCCRAANTVRARDGLELFPEDDTLSTPGVLP